MSKHLLAAAALLATVSAQSAVSLATPAATYAQTFDSLATTGTTNAWVNNSTLPGFSLFTTAGVAVTTYRADIGGSNTGAIYSWGATGSSERALGGVGSASFSGYIALALSNDTNLVFDSFTLRYDGEQWRNGGNTASHPMAVEYGFGASFAAVSTWTPAATLGWTSPVSTATAASVDGNVAGLVANVGGTTAVNWAPSTTLWVRWIEANDAGSDHGLAIDNLSFSVTAVPEPGTTGLLLAGLAAVGLLARRRA